MKKWSVVSGQWSVASRLFMFAFFLLLTACCLPLSISAQVDDEPKDLVPPSPKVISEDEKRLLDAERDAKKRTQLYLDLMEARLKKAETATTEENYRAALDALGGFHALLDDSLKFLTKNNNESRKVLNSFKTLEMALRKQTTRLENVRRGMPFKYGWYVQKLMKAVREARSRAVEPLFDDTVVPANKTR